MGRATSIHPRRNGMKKLEWPVHGRALSQGRLGLALAVTLALGACGGGAALDAESTSASEVTRDASIAAATTGSALPTTEFNLPAQSRHSFSPLPCASEGERCTVPSNTTVAYGAPGRFEVVVRSGAFTCGNDLVRTDPAPGIRKACYLPSSVHGPKQIENLNRGAVAFPSGSGTFIGWRLLGTEPRRTQFNVYGSQVASGDAAWVNVSGAPVANRTNFLHADSAAFVRYLIVPVLDGVEQIEGRQVVSKWDSNFIDIPVDPPTASDSTVTYRVAEASVGDLRGTGGYDLVVKWEPSNAKDNGSENDGYTDKTYLDAYTLTGTVRQLWRIDLGINIRSGAHYTPFVVYDLDGDGKAEVALRTAEGSTDSTGRLLNPAPVPGGVPDRRNGRGRVLSGPEWLTVFSGATGRRVAQVPFVPDRGPPSEWMATWGDTYGGRMDRFGAGVAYLNGTTPSLIMQRGYYERTVVAAWDLSGGQLQRRWVFDTHQGTQRIHPTYNAQGAHHIIAADVNYDGRDEIVLGSAVIGHDGQPFHSTGFGHGDAVQVGDFDPSRPGIEIFTTHENPWVHRGTGVLVRSGHNGQAIWSRTTSCNGAGFQDVGRGLILDLDASTPGAESVASGMGIVLANGRTNPVRCDLGGGVSESPMAIHWDGDLTRENQRSSPRVMKWNPQTRTNEILFDLTRVAPFSGADKGQSLVVADILGDWREEMAFYKRPPAGSTEGAAVRIYTSPFPTATTMADGRTPVPPIPTLMHDPQYRVAVASQNSGYNQSPNTSFFLGEGMSEPVVRPLYTPATLGVGGGSDDWLVEVQLRTTHSGLCLNANTVSPNVERVDVSVWGCVDSVAQQRWTATTQDGHPVVKVGTGGNMCLQASHARAQVDTPLHTWPCSESSRLSGGRYFLNASSQIESADQRGLCVAVPDSPAWGTALRLAACTSPAARRWLPQMPDPVILRSALDGGACLSHGGTGGQFGEAWVMTHRCSVGSPRQQLRLTSLNGQPVAQLGASGTMCLQTNNQRTDAGTALHTWPCEWARQGVGGRFALTPRGQLESTDRPGMCVEASNASTADGNALRLAHCAPVTTQQWLMSR